MARVNVGLNPRVLSDQHLVAESVEITMITGGLRKHNYVIKGDVPNKYPLGKGHINFFKPRLKYLEKRLAEVNKEMIRRGFKPGTHIDLEEFPKQYHGDWTPTIADTMVLRMRVADRLLNPKNGKPGKDYHRYEGVVLGDKIQDFHKNILESELYYV
jgi:hypothetical protein